MGPRRRRGDALSVSLAAALAPALASAPVSTPPATPAPRSPLTPRSPRLPPPQPEWARVDAAIRQLFAAPPPPPAADVFGHPGRLRALQGEVSALLLGSAGALVPDFLRGRVLPAAMRALVDACEAALLDASDAASEADDVEVVLEAWARLWRHLLPALLAIFVHVRSSKPGVRALALLAFRDEVLLAREGALAKALTGDGAAAQGARARLAHPLLVAAQAAALGPPHNHTQGDASALRVEVLLAQCVSPLLGARGRYEDFDPAPAVPAPRPSEHARLRMRQARAGRPLLRPLSVAAGQRLNTLADLFSVAAAAQRLRADT